MGALKVKEIHALSGEILRLEDQLSLARAKLNILLGVTEAERKPRSGNLEGMRAKVISWLENNLDFDHSISDVAKALEEEELAVGKALYNAFLKGRIAKTSRGRYQGKGLAVPVHLKSEEGTKADW